MTSDVRSIPLASLDIDEDLRFQKRQWRCQHVAWWIMALIVLLAVLGLLGPGPLSRATARDSSGAVSVDYNRFEHHASNTELRVRVDRNHGAEGKVRFWISQDYLAGIQVVEVSPPPFSVEQKGRRQIFTFLADPADRLDATIRYQHTDWGRTSAMIGLPDGPEATFTQTVYP